MSKRAGECRGRSVAGVGGAERNKSYVSSEWWRVWEVCRTGGELGGEYDVTKGRYVLVSEFGGVCERS